MQFELISPEFPTVQIFVCIARSSSVKIVRRQKIFTLESIIKIKLLKSNLELPTNTYFSATSISKPHNDRKTGIPAQSNGSALGEDLCIALVPSNTNISYFRMKLENLISVSKRNNSFPS